MKVVQKIFIFLVFEIFIGSNIVECAQQRQQSIPNIEETLYQDLIRHLKFSDNAQTTNDGSIIKDKFSVLLRKILETKCGKLLVSSILKELERPSSNFETLFSREKVKELTVLNAEKWAYFDENFPRLLKMPMEQTKIRFSVIDKSGEIKDEDADPRISLFHELLHWYHELADIITYQDNEKTKKEDFYNDDLFPKFINILQDANYKEYITNTYNEGNCFSVEEINTICGNGNCDFFKPRSALSENLLRVEYNLCVRILYSAVGDAKTFDAIRTLKGLSLAKKSELATNITEAYSDKIKRLPNEQALQDYRQQPSNNSDFNLANYPLTYINVENLFSYTGSVELFDLESSTNQHINQQIQPKIPEGNLSVKGNDRLFMINEKTEYVKTKELDHNTDIAINEKPGNDDIILIANAFLSKVLFVFEKGQGADIITKNISAIQRLTYKIASNPVGFRLFQRILNKIPTTDIIKFKIEGSEFIYQDKSVTIPTIKFDDFTANRNDNVSYGPKLLNNKLALSTHNRPFYIGLVHELIHLMHDLEKRRSGTGSNPLDHDDFGGDALWGNSDDLHVIWGIYAVEQRPDPEYDNVSELTFRIADNVPIRMFYDRTGVPFNETVTTLDKYIYEEDNITVENNIIKDDNYYLDSDWDEEGINPIRILNSVFDNIRTDKKIILSL